MRSSDTKAAKRGGTNSDVNKLLGTPHNVSSMTGHISGNSTKAASRPAVNSEITGMKWAEQPNNWGRGV